MTKENFIRVKKAEEALEYAPKYYVEGIVRANDIDVAGGIAELLYFFNSKIVSHTKTIRAMAEGKVPNYVAKPLNVYWYEGIGYAESQIKDKCDALDFEDNYGGTTSNGYNHAVEFYGILSENQLNNLLWSIKELSSKIGWACELDSEFGNYSDSNADCEFELKIDTFEDDDEKLA